MNEQLSTIMNKVWANVKLAGSIEDVGLESMVNERIIDYFMVGPSYYYIFDMKNRCFSFMHPDITKVLGFDHTITLDEFLSRIHPEDQRIMVNYENTIIHFFKNLPNDKITKYKFSYDYRILNDAGKYVRLYQQVAVLQYDEAKNSLHTLGIHTDISHLKTSNHSVLSFIGLAGEPSFYNVKVDEVCTPSKGIFTKREKEIVRQMISGRQTAEIANNLYISKHTVDTHRKNILNKTNTHSAVELAAMVVSSGLL